MTMIRTAMFLAISGIIFGGIVQNDLLPAGAQNKNADTAQTRTDASLATARELMAHRQDAEAIPMLSDVIARQPDLLEANALRGVCYFRMEEFLRATRDFEIYFKTAKEPAPVLYHRSYGLSLIQLGRYAQALRQFNIDVEREPKTWDHYFDRCGCYIALKQYDKALLDANAMIVLRPDHFRYAMRAKLYFTMHNYQKSLEDWTTAIKLAPDRVDYLSQRAECYDLLGKPALGAADRKKRDDYIQ